MARSFISGFMKHPIWVSTKPAAGHNDMHITAALQMQVADRHYPSRKAILRHTFLLIFLENQCISSLKLNE
jgi:hypothetical protein